MTQKDTIGLSLFGACSEFNRVTTNCIHCSNGNLRITAALSNSSKICGIQSRTSGQSVIDHVQVVVVGGDNGDDDEQRYTREYKNMVQIDSDEDAFEAMAKEMYTGRLQCINKDLLPLLTMTRQLTSGRSSPSAV